MAYPVLRRWVFIIFLFLYALLSYFGNRQLVDRAGIPPIAEMRTLLTMITVVIMALMSDRIMKERIEKQQWGKLIGILLGLAGIITLLRIGLDWLMILVLNPERIVFFGSPAHWATNGITTLLIPVFLLPLHFADGWIKRQRMQYQIKQNSLQMKALQLDAELKFLKAQVNPHFLFNVLNNVYSLIEYDATQAQSVVLKLSSMMRYMLYECQAPLVPLEREIAYLQDYIELFQLKKDGEMNIKFEIAGERESCKIAPMLLTPLFENAFKHGNLENLKEGWMKATLEVEDAIMDLRLCNSIGSSTHKSNEPGGIGLKNVQERLKLSYPDAHVFEAKGENGEFHVHLTLTLILFSP